MRNTASKIIHYCSNNLLLKILCLVLAICIWIFTAFSSELSCNLPLTVELRNIPVGYTVVSAPKRELLITVSGPSILIDGVQRANRNIILNMRNTKEGKTSFSSLDSYLKLPEGVKVIRISPATLEVELAAKKIIEQQGDSQ